VLEEHRVNLGMGELLVVLAIVLLVFGANRLPQLGEAVGKGIKNLKRGLKSDDDIDVTPQGTTEPKQVSSRSSASDGHEVTDAEVVERKA